MSLQAAGKSESFLHLPEQFSRPWWYL